MTRVCFVGFDALPVLSERWDAHGIGGEAVQHALLARAFRARGYDVSIAGFDYGQPHDLVLDGIRVLPMFAPDAGVPGVRYLHPRLTGIWAALARADADVYYTSCAGMMVGVVAAFCRRHGRASAFRIAHDSDCDPKRLLIRYARDRWLYAWGLRRMDVVFAQSEQQQRAMQANYGMASVPAGMLVDPAGPARSLAARDIDVLWVNNIRPFKRADLVLDLAGRLPGRSVHVIGGPQSGYEALYAEIERRARALPNVTFHGRVSYHAVNRFYERARVFLNTSDSEGFPNSYLQSWRRGTPVVAFFDPDGIIARGGLGDVPGDVGAMAAAVERRLGSAAEWAACSARCVHHMDTRHGDDVVLAPYRDAVDRLAARVRR